MSRSSLSYVFFEEFKKNTGSAILLAFYCEGGGWGLYSLISLLSYKILVKFVPRQRACIRALRRFSKQEDGTKIDIQSLSNQLSDR